MSAKSFENNPQSAA